MELLRYVNTFWNRFPYREDITNWGKADYWVWPNLFLKKSGDCEDYAIIKYFTLKELGMDTDKLRIVVLRDTLRRLSHAVLAVYMDNDIVILDNISNAIMSRSSRSTRRHAGPICEAKKQTSNPCTLLIPTSPPSRITS